MSIAGEHERAARRSSLGRNLALGGIALAVVAIAARVTMIQQAPQRARHVILISMDTTRPDHFGCYGNPWISTPFMDQLAKQSLLFMDYTTAANTTLASHTTSFTGKYPHRHGVPRNGFVVNDENLMLTEVLKQAGFSTAGFLGSFALDGLFGFNQGFDHYDEQFDVMAGEGGADQNQRAGDKVTDAVLSYLDKTGVPQRLFLFAHFFDAHMPYAPPAPYDAMYGVNDNAPRQMSPHPAASQDGGSVDPRVSRQWSLYAGEISFMDAQIGRLLRGLRERGILDDALLVIINDHGENLGDHWGQPFDHGWTVYQNEARGFCLIRLPKGELGGRKLTTPTPSIDLMPTILNYLRLPVPAGIDGTAVDLLTPNPEHNARSIFSEATKPWEQVEVGRKWVNDAKPRAVRDGQWKYIITPYRRMEELYNLAADPGEKINLLKNANAETRQRLAEMRAALKTYDAASNPLPTHFESTQRDDTVRRLKALGYIDSGDGEREPEDEADGTANASSPPLRKRTPASKPQSQPVKP